MVRVTCALVIVRVVMCILEYVRGSNVCMGRGKALCPLRTVSLPNELYLGVVPDINDHLQVWEFVYYLQKKILNSFAPIKLVYCLILSRLHSDLTWY